MRGRKRRFGGLDAVILAVLGGLLGYLVYRAQYHFYYRWDWQLIPGYLLHYDAEQQRWMPSLLAQGLIVTLRLTVWGSVLALCVGGVLGICRTRSSLFLRLISRFYVELIRNTPPLVFIFIFYFFISSQVLTALELESWLAEADPATVWVLTGCFGPVELLPNFLSGLLCLALFEGAYVAEIVRAGIQAVPRGQWEAGQALGLRASQVLRAVVLPQALGKMTPPLAGQLISLIKDSSLISLISIQEMTFSGNELAVSSGRVFEVWITVAALYFMLCFGLARLFRRLEQQGSHG